MRTLFTELLVMLHRRMIWPAFTFMCASFFAATQAWSSADFCATVNKTADGFVALRSSPRADSTMLMSLSAGTKVFGHVGQGQGAKLPEWAQVVSVTVGKGSQQQTIGVSGYVRGKLLTEVECSVR